MGCHLSMNKISTMCILYNLDMTSTILTNLDGGRGHLTSLVKIQRDDLGEAACVIVHRGGTVSEGL